MKILIFKLDEIKYAIALETVSELITLDSWTQIPLAKEYCPGIIMARKSFIPLIDLKILLNLSVADLIDRILIIIKINKQQRALIVYEIIEIVTTTDEQRIDNKYISGIISFKEEQILLLNSKTIILAPISSC